MSKVISANMKPGIAAKLYVFIRGMTRPDHAKVLLGAMKKIEKAWPEIINAVIPSGDPLLEVSRVVSFSIDERTCVALGLLDIWNGNSANMDQRVDVSDIIKKLNIVGWFDERASSTFKLEEYAKDDEEAEIFEDDPQIPAAPDNVVAMPAPANSLSGDLELAS